MKKTLLLLVAAIACVATTAWADDDVELNIGAVYGEAASSQGLEYTENFTMLDFFYVYAENGSIKINSNKKTFNETECTYRLQLGGSGALKPAKRYISFTPTEACTLTVYSLSGNSGESRSLILVDSDSTLVDQITSYGSVTENADYEMEISTAYANETLYLMSANSGINIYYIKVAYASNNNSNAISSLATDAEVVSTEYYTLSGAKVTEPGKGVTIVKQLLSDGKVVTSKVIK